MMLSFLVFVWLSHSGVLPGGPLEHLWGGLGTLIIAVGGVIMYKGTARGSRNFANAFCFSYGILLVVNAIVFSFLRAMNIIGPDHGLGSFVVGVLYYFLGAIGIVEMIDALEDNVFR